MGSTSLRRTKKCLDCLFVCLVHGVPVVCDGRRLTKEGPYATRRQAEAVLFVRRKPTPPFAGCQGNLLFRGSRGLQTGRPVDHRPYSARHVGLKVESFWEQQTLCSPSTPNGRQLLIRNATLQPEARAMHVPALSSVCPVDVHVLSVQSVVCAFWP